MVRKDADLIDILLNFIAIICSYALVVSIGGGLYVYTTAQKAEAEAEVARLERESKEPIYIFSWSTEQSDSTTATTLAEEDVSTGYPRVDVLAKQEVTVVPMMSGTGNNQLGTIGCIRANKSDFEAMSSDEYKTFIETVVNPLKEDGHNFNYVEFEDGTALFFHDYSSYFPASYGLLNSEKVSLDPVYGTIPYADEEYSFLPYVEPEL